MLSLSDLLRQMFYGGSDLLKWVTEKQTLNKLLGSFIERTNRVQNCVTKLRTRAAQQRLLRIMLRMLRNRRLQMDGFVRFIYIVAAPLMKEFLSDFFLFITLADWTSFRKDGRFIVCKLFLFHRLFTAVQPAKKIVVFILCCNFSSYQYSQYPSTFK